MSTLLLYLSGTLTYPHETRRAREVQRQAHALYADTSGSIDPALLRMDEALCFVQERRVSEACELAGDTYLAVPADRRTQILGDRVRNVVEAVPQRMRTSKPARTLGEMLALPPARA